MAQNYIAQTELQLATSNPRFTTYMHTEKCMKHWLKDIDKILPPPASSPKGQPREHIMR